jgi:photosystem II stability/assembly factor-like uncharacterized protein
MKGKLKTKKWSSVLISVIVLYSLLMGFGRHAWAIPKISLEIQSGTYLGTAPDPWIKDGWVTADSKFQLDVVIRNVNFENIKLIVAVPEGESGSITIDSNAISESDFVVGQPPEVKPHGIYPTAYAYVPLNNLAASGSNSTGSTYTLSVEWTGYSKIHFDAFGTDTRGKIWRTPISKDATVSDFFWVKLGGPPGGIGYDIRHSFSDYNRWYVTDDKAGFHISTDRGLTWKESNMGIFTSPIGSVSVFSATVDPHNSNIVWSGTRAPGYVYKSTDAGKTWTDVTGSSGQGTTWLDIYGGNGYTYRGFTVDPRSSDIVYAMVEIDAFRFLAEGKFTEFDLNRDASGGRILRTTDGGNSWSIIWEGRALARYLWIDPGNPNVLYASTGIFDRKPLDYPAEGVTATNCGGIGVIRSTDGGNTWTEFGFNEGIENLTGGSLYMHPSDSRTLLVAGGSKLCEFEPPSEPGEDPIPQHGGVYLTTDGGDSWETVIENDVITSVEFCDKDPRIAYAVSAEVFYRSENGGRTWTPFGDVIRKTWGPPGINPGVPIDVQTDSDNCDRVLINNYAGGVFLSTDGGQNWSNSSSGYSGADVHTSVYIDPEDAAHVYVATAMAVWESNDGGVTWKGLSNPDLLVGATILAGDPADLKHMLAAKGELGTPPLYETHDGGASWTEIYQLRVPEELGAADFMRWLNIVFAPSNPEIVYGATMNYPEELLLARVLAEPIVQGLGIYRSIDGGTTWEPPDDPLIANVGFRGLAVDPKNANIVYAGAFFNRGLFKSDDGGNTWSSINIGLPAPHGHFSAIAVDPKNTNVVYAGGSSGLFKSLNAGASWTRLTAGLDVSVNVSGIVVDPTNTSVVYVSTFESGLFYTENAGTLFKPLNQGINLGEGVHLGVLTLAISNDGSVLYAGSANLGLYRLGTTSAP